MANQRKAGKKKVGFWVSESEKAAMITKGAGVIIAALLIYHIGASREHRREDLEGYKGI